MKIAALAGGVGGAELADGLARVMPPENLTIVVNSGDDFEHLGLYICPDWTPSAIPSRVSPTQIPDGGALMRPGIPWKTSKSSAALPGST